MTVFYDASESRFGTRLPESVIQYGYRWDRIEQDTGGDFIVVPELSPTHKAILMKKKNMTLAQVSKALDIPIASVIKLQATEADMSSVLLEYLFRGAVVVQRKSGSDLIDSIQGPRLEESLARMNSAIPYRAQRLLLYTGVFSERNGNVVLDGTTTNLNYMAFAMALTAWCNRGGTVVNLASDSLILDWIKLLEKQLEAYKHASTKFVYPEVYYPSDMPDDEDLLQMPIEVKDWRKTFATFPQIGPDRINALKKITEDDLGFPTLWNALQYACSFKTMKGVPGWGKKSVENVRRWLGIPDGWELVLQPQGEQGETNE